MWRSTLIAAAILLFAAAPATAQTGPVAAPCKADIARYCASTSQDGVTRACLEAQKHRVSPVCRAALEANSPGQPRAKGPAKN